MEMEIDIPKSRKEEIECVLVQAVAKVALAPTPRRSWAELASEVMHNELVLSNIAGKLPSYALLNLRETCTLWNNQFIPEVRKNHKAVALKWSDCDPWSSQRGAFDFTKVMKSSSKIPFSRYRISGYEGLDRLARYKLYKFMSTLGNTITTLFLEWPVDDLPTEQLRRIIFQSTPALSELLLQPTNEHPESPLPPASTHEKYPDTNCRGLATSLPKLRQIRVIRWDQDASQGREFTQLVSDMIQCASGLELLELRDYGSRDGNFIRTNLARLLNDGTQIHKLKTLVLFNFMAQDLEILIQLARQNGNSLQLHTLKAEIDWRKMTGSEQLQGIVELFHIFLETQLLTLKFLRVSLQRDRNEETRQNPIRIPQMAHLTQLRISNWGLPREEMVFGKVVFENVLGSDSFVDTFPELRQFACNFTEDLDRLHHPRVQELTLKIDIRHLIRFRPVFPSLTRLELKLTAKNSEDIDDYTGIWTTWPNLTVLHLTGTKTCEDMDFDSFLTGVPRLKLKTMMQDLTYSVATQEQPVCSSDILDTLHSILNKYKTEAGIRDLKQLRELEIYTYGQKTPKYRGHRLTDIGGYLGVGLASPCLKRVFIRGSAKNMVSEKCRAFIKSIFGMGLEIMF